MRGGESERSSSTGGGGSTKPLIPGSHLLVTERTWRFAEANRRLVRSPHRRRQGGRRSQVLGVRPSGAGRSALPHIGRQHMRVTARRTVVATICATGIFTA